LFHPERLSAPSNTKVPTDAVEDPRRKRVFVGSMADLFGRWVPREWISQICDACIANLQWDYLMLTKFPSRYLEFLDRLPPTAWLGTSVDEQKRVRIAEQAFAQIQGKRVKYLSLEPFKADLKFTDLSMFDWIIIGSQTETRQPDGVVPAYAPPFDRVARIVAQGREAGCKIYLKPNLLGVTGPQSPGMVLPQEVPYG
jgi:protein gp37